MRVSIVATSLDNQQPETKSVINMVHRIQNRNPGYSDFGTNNSTTPLIFLITICQIPSYSVVQMRLKLENEVLSENLIMKQLMR